MKNLFIGALILTTGLSALADSAYSKISRNPKICKVKYDSTKDPNAEIDGLDVICPGVHKDYGIRYSGGDERYDISLIYMGTEVNLTDSYGGFKYTPASQVEWLLNGSSKRKQPKALIHRINLVVPDTGASISYLLVTKLAGINSCVVAQIPPGPRQNILARQVDLVNAACISIGDGANGDEGGS